VKIGVKELLTGGKQRRMVKGPSVLCYWGDVRIREKRCLDIKKAENRTIDGERIREERTNPSIRGTSLITLSLKIAIVLLAFLSAAIALRGNTLQNQNIAATPGTPV
jgi:hypothetical protein